MRKTTCVNANKENEKETNVLAVHASADKSVTTDIDTKIDRRKVFKIFHRCSLMYSAQLQNITEYVTLVTNTLVRLLQRMINGIGHIDVRAFLPVAKHGQFSWAGPYICIRPELC